MSATRILWGRIVVVFAIGSDHRFPIAPRSLISLSQPSGPRLPGGEQALYVGLRSVTVAYPERVRTQFLSLRQPTCVRPGVGKPTSLPRSLKAPSGRRCFGRPKRQEAVSLQARVSTLIAWTTFGCVERVRTRFLPKGFFAVEGRKSPTACCTRSPC